MRTISEMLAENAAERRRAIRRRRIAAFVTAVYATLIGAVILHVIAGAIERAAYDQVQSYPRGH